MASEKELVGKNGEIVGSGAYFLLPYDVRATARDIIKDFEARRELSKILEGVFGRF